MRTKRKIHEHREKSDVSGPNRPETGAPRRILTNGGLAAELFEAIRLEHIEVHFQPIVATASGRIIGAEALLRWDHETLGLLPASTFTQVAEQTGMLGLLGRRALNTACATAAIWHKPADFRMQVNANVQQLSSRTFLADVRQALQRSGLPPEQLAIEITETVRLPTTGQVLQNLTGLRGMGVGIELDDYGTGYCSPLYIKELPISGIKVDQVFVAGLGRETVDETIVSHMASMARALGLTICAEGVEHPQQRDRLLDYGIDRAQGWMYSPAVNGGAFADLLDAQRTL